MSKNNDIFTLPAGPTELCFDKNEFMKTSFSVDDFLHENRNAGSLEGIRDDLGIYLKVLRSSMIELINEDYADFVNLSANLIGLDQSINRIKTPLENLKTEILNIQQTLKNTMNEILEIINEKDLIRNEKFQYKCFECFQKSLNKIKQLIDTINEQQDDNDFINILLERVSLQIIQINFSQKFCTELLRESDVNDVKVLINIYLDILKKFFLKSINNNLNKNLELALKIYINLDKVDLCENIIRNDVLHELFNEIITEKNLQKNDLDYIYNQIFRIIDNKLLLLLKLTENNDNFNFLINSVWIEIENNIEINLTSIFAPGNPDVFYNKYSKTLLFLNKFELKIKENNINNLKSFYNSKQYKSFLLKWNLPVYFQIRFQEIGGIIENSCNVKITDNLINQENNLKLIPFHNAYICILKCWKSGIYIEELFQKFWKLTLQILARLLKWIDYVLNLKNDNGFNKFSFYIEIYSDITKLKLKFNEILNLGISNTPFELKNNDNLLEMSLNESKLQFDQRLIQIEQFITNDLINICSINIKFVNDIPRLFRKTNKDVPSKPCSYIEQIIQPIKQFDQKYTLQIVNNKIKLFQNILSKLTIQYYTAVDDVLISVQKTEESLRRLKNLREKSTTSNQTIVGSSSANSLMTDDDKIRLQLQIDVNSWVEEIHKLEINVNDVEKLVDLINLVDSAIKYKLNDDK